MNTKEIKRSDIKIGGSSYLIDIWLLNLFALKHFQLPYEDCKAEAKAEIRNLIPDQKNTNTYEIEHIIMYSLVSKRIQKEIDKLR